MLSHGIQSFICQGDFYLCFRDGKRSAGGGEASDGAAGSRVPHDLNRDGVKGRLWGAKERTRPNQQRGK